MKHLSILNNMHFIYQNTISNFQFNTLAKKSFPIFKLYMLLFDRI